MAIFVVSSLAILTWCGYQLGKRRSFSAVWILALIMQVAMVYMWLPDWWAPLTWVLVAYFTVEGIAWLAGLVNDTRGGWRLGGEDAPGFAVLAHPLWQSNVCMAIMSFSMAYMFAAMQLM